MKKWSATPSATQLRGGRSEDLREKQILVLDTRPQSSVFGSAHGLGGPTFSSKTVTQSRPVGNAIYQNRQGDVIPRLKNGERGSREASTWPSSQRAAHISHLTCCCALPAALKWTSLGAQSVPVMGLFPHPFRPTFGCAVALSACRIKCSEHRLS